MSAPDRTTSQVAPARVSVALWLIVRIIAEPYFRLVLRLRIDGREHIPRSGAVLIVANHRSFLDPPLIGYCASPRRIYYMAKDVIFRHAPFAWLIRNLGAFPVTRDRLDRDAIRYSRELFRRGDVLLMFPEGIRGTDPGGALGPGLPGAGLLALDPGVTVVPAAIWDSRRRLGRVRISFGPPIPPPANGDAPRSERNQVATERIMGAIEGLLSDIRERPPR